MIRQTAEWLQDHKILASFLSVMKNLSRNQHTFTGIEGMVNDLITVLYQILHPAGRLIQRMSFGDMVCQIMGRVKHGIGHAEPDLFIQRFLQLILPDLSILIKIGFPDHIRHAGLNDLESVFLQIIFNIMVCTRMEIQQIFSHNQDPWFLLRAIICHILQGSDTILESSGSSHNPPLFQAIHHLIHGFFKGRVGTALDLLIRPDLSQQFLQRIDHRKGKSNLHCGEKVHLEPRMYIMIIHIIVCQDRHVGESRIIQSFAKKCCIMGQTAVTDIFAHADGRILHIIFSAL